LIGIWGSSQILLGVSLILIALAATAYRPRLGESVVVLALLAFPLAVGNAGMFVVPGVIAQIDTPYQRIRIQEGTDLRTGRPARTIATDRFGAQSIRYLDGDELAAPYLRYFYLAEHFFAAPKNVLMIGAAGYSYPQDFIKRFPQARIDVVELDPGMTDVARTYFGFVDHPHISSLHEDGRVFLNHAPEGHYDMVFIDAFRALVTPYHLITREAVEKVHRTLTSGGIAVINVIASMEGPASDILKAQLATWREYFPHAEVVAVNTLDDSKSIQNMLIVASKDAAPYSWKSKNKSMQTMLDHRIRIDIGEGKVMTDDFAPSERYADQVITQLFQGLKE
jgi:spermidine synthase